MCSRIAWWLPSDSLHHQLTGQFDIDSTSAVMWTAIFCSRWGLCIHPPGGGDDRILSPAMNLCVHVGSGHSSPLFSVDKQQICTWLSVRIHTRIYISCDFVVHNFVHHNYFGAFRCSLAFICSFVCSRTCNSLGPSFHTPRIPRIHIHSLCNIQYIVPHLPRTHA